MREDWITCQLGDLLEIQRGGSPRPIKEFITNRDNGINWVKIGDTTESGKFISSTEQKIKPEGLHKTRLVYPGDFILSNSMSFGRPYIMSIKGAIHDGWLLLRDTSDILNKSFLFHILGSPFVYNQFSKLAKGSTVKNLNISLVSQVKINLVSKSEQRAIVAKIEELFSELDKGEEDLKKAQEQLKVYRQAVLKKAFENIDNETTLEEIKKDSLIGLVRSSGIQNSNGDGTAYLKMDKIDMIGNVDLEDLVYVQTNNDEIEKYALKTGDILLNTRNSYDLVGKTGIIRGVDKVVVFNNNIMRIRVNEGYDPSFICYQLISPFVRKQMDKFKKATTSVCALYQRNLFPLKLKVTDIEMQHQIVQEIESRLSVCNSIETGIRESLDKSKALRQSILKKAFEGTLLSEEEIAACKAAPDYEPASVLLERIKAEKKKN